MGPAACLLLVLAQPSPAPGSGIGPQEVRDRAGRDEVVIGRYRLKRQKNGEYLADTHVFRARVATDGGVSFEDPFRVPAWVVWPVLALVTAVGGSSTPPPRNVQGDLRRGTKQPAVGVSEEDLWRDPDHAHKMHFLAETERFRSELRRQIDEAALRRWERRVEALAGNQRMPAARRRQVLFELWTECDESPGGLRARAAVEAAIRRYLPAGGGQGYGAGELERLNRQLPAETRFDPYAAPP